MKQIKKIIGLLLVSSPFIGIGIGCYLNGDILAFFIAIGLVACVVGILHLGIELLDE
jgi:hypothetical protein